LRQISDDGELLAIIPNRPGWLETHGVRLLRRGGAGTREVAPKPKNGGLEVSTLYVHDEVDSAAAADVGGPVHKTQARDG
jgi:hypothetical protein